MMFCIFKYFLSLENSKKHQMQINVKYPPKKTKGHITFVCSVKRHDILLVFNELLNELLIEIYLHLLCFPCIFLTFRYLYITKHRLLDSSYELP